jgi:Spy/CpxP family protein refolding chaperone
MQKSQKFVGTVAVCGLAACMLSSAPVWAQEDVLVGPTMEAFDIEMDSEPFTIALPAPGEDVFYYSPAQSMPFPPMAFAPGARVMPLPPGVGAGAIAATPPQDVLFMAAAPAGDEHDKKDCGGGGGGWSRRGHASMFKNLNLTDDQYEKLYSIKRETMGQMAGKMGNMATLHMDLKDALLQADLDKSKIQSVQDKINALKTDMANMRLNQHISMLNVLTPEQRKELRLAMIKSSASDGHRRMLRHRR